MEDNPDVVDYLKSILEANYQLDIAYNGRIGIEKALETIPDLIISDVMMPERDGYQVLETLKNDERTSHIPMLIVDGEGRCCLQAGRACGGVPTPICPNRLTKKNCSPRWK
ncbi:MAG: response regulator [Saprospiraceae bacterium]|nr:response regulator [Saprospiraceae bacterium]